MTMDDYLSARPITTPFGLYDCDVPCDASIAVIVSDASVAGDLPHPAIRIEAVGTQIIERVSWDQDTLTHEPQVLGQSAHLWTRTEPAPADVDLALALRRLHLQRHLVARGARLLRVRRGAGLARRRPAHRPRRRAARSTRTAASSPRAARTASASSTRRSRQLRHDAGERQVQDAQTAVVTSGGGTPSGVLLLQRNDA